MRFTQRLGFWGGLVLGPMAAIGAAIRHARFLHPEGVLYAARVEPLVNEGPRGLLAHRLAGPALVRLSGAWWKHLELPDVLGLAIRFRQFEPSTRAEPDDQDLLLATIRQPATTLLAPATTEQHDYLANDYYAVSPFEVDDVGRARFRAVAVPVQETGESREEKLEGAVWARRAELQLEVQLPGTRGYQPLARVALVERLNLDQGAMAFDPYRSGRGIHPVGFVQGLRRLTYALARLGRGLPAPA